VLAVDQCPLEARLTHGAGGTDGLRLGGVLFGRRIEDGGIEAPARTLLPPGQVHRDHFLVAAFIPLRSPPPKAPPSGPWIMEPQGWESPGLRLVFCPGRPEGNP